jgi:hypothetical protein
MKQIVLIVLALLVPAIDSVAAGEVRQIELADGSVLTGEVLSYANGVYTVRTGSLGTITIEDSRVRSISSPGQAASSAGPSYGQARSLEEQMRSDEQVMNMIRSLKDDPAFRRVLEDPGILRAVEAGDLATLMANPRFMELMNNPTVREIQNKIGH